MTSPTEDVLLSLALDLTRSLEREDRYRRLLEAVRAVLPCDAACLLAAEGDRLRPLAGHGLVPAVMGRIFFRKEHPRLDLIAGADGPLVFPDDSKLPDPFDGLLAGDETALAHVHACLGCPLRVDGDLVGLLTADALEPGAFDRIDRKLLAWLAALGGAALRTSALIETLSSSARRLGRVASDLVRADAEQRGGLVGQSSAMARLRREIEIVAGSDLTVLVLGETGTGKELVARAVHSGSRRGGEPLLYLNCAALPESVAESELFGHIRGAFTGADQDRAGKLEVADGGTLFLDEIGELPLSVQPKLLRALQEGEIQRLGADRTLSVDVRIIAATNRDLEREVASGRFRPDLYHRLDVYPIRVPPLRERAEDVPLLAGHFCDQARVRLGTGPVRLTPEAQRVLQDHPWPGNVRELENFLFRAVLQRGAHVEPGAPVVLDARHLLPGLSVGAEPLPEIVAPEPPEEGSLRAQVEAFERAAIERAVARAGGNWAEAARALGMHRSNLHHKARRLGLR